MLVAVVRVGRLSDDRSISSTHVVESERPKPTLALQSKALDVDFDNGGVLQNASDIAGGGTLSQLRASCRSETLMPVLYTDRLALRQFRDSDVDSLYEIQGNRRHMR